MNKSATIALLIVLGAGIPTTLAVVLSTCDGCQKYEYHPVTQKQLQEATKALEQKQAASAGQAASAVCQKWSYKTLDGAKLSPEELAQQLQELGEQGWELVQGAPMYVFKRCRAEEGERGAQ